MARVLTRVVVWVDEKDFKEARRIARNWNMELEEVLRLAIKYGVKCLQMGIRI